MHQARQSLNFVFFQNTKCTRSIIRLAHLEKICLKKRTTINFFFIFKKMFPLIIFLVSFAITSVQYFPILTFFGTISHKKCLNCKLDISENSVAFFSFLREYLRFWEVYETNWKKNWTFKLTCKKIYKFYNQKNMLELQISFSER